LLLHEVEKRGLAPVDVVEEDDQRRGLRRRFEQLANAPGDLLARSRDLLVAEQGFDRPGRRRFESDRVAGRQLPEHLDDRPVGDAFAVRQAASAHKSRIVERPEELGREAGLADAGDAQEGEQLARSVASRLVVRIAEPAKLPLATDERRVEPSRVGRFLLAKGDDSVRNDGFALSLQLPRLEWLRLDGVPYQPERLCAEQDLARRGSLLQASSDVDRIARGQALFRSGDDLARVDADPQLEPGSEVPLELFVQVIEHFAELAGRADRAEGVVLVHPGDAEDSHYGVADEFLDGAAMPFDDPPGLLEVPGQHATQRLGIEPLAERRRARHVREDDRDGLPNLADGLLAIEREPARGAKRRTRLVFVPAGWTSAHAPSVRRLRPSFQPVGAL
jgi:hypothetical protein